MSPAGKTLMAAVRIALLAYGGLVVLMAVGQRHYIYFPMRAAEADLAALAGRLNLSAWRDAQGRLIGWRSRQALLASPRYRVVVFHGNAGMALHRTYFVEGFQALGQGLDWEVFLFEYPGYGARPGQPSERAFFEAAVQALETLASENDRPLYLVGESLGCAVAAYGAAQRPDLVRGLFLVTPFPALADLAAHHYPYLPVRWLLRDRFETARYLAEYQGSVGVLLAGRDEIAPPELGRRLFDAYAGPKKLWVQEGRTHNELDYNPQASWWRELAEFWQAGRS